MASSLSCSVTGFNLVAHVQLLVPNQLDDVRCVYLRCMFYARRTLEDRGMARSALYPSRSCRHVASLLVIYLLLKVC